jgi:hypothetical protein
MLTTLLGILTAILLAFATGFGAYLWDTSHRIQSRLAISAVMLMMVLIYLAQQQQPTSTPTPTAAPTSAPMAAAEPPVTTGSLPAPVENENSSIAMRRAVKKRDTSEPPGDNFFKRLFTRPQQPKAP